MRCLFTKLFYTFMAAPFAAAGAKVIAQDWRTASREPVGLAPDPKIVFGIAASGVDGLELNLLGLNFGLSPTGLKLPLVGRIGGYRPNGAPVAEEPAVNP